jgi:HEAT repeat protein
MRSIAALLLALGACACASAPPVAPPPGPPFEQKIAWMLRLEDSRTLRDPAPAPPPVAPPVRGRRPAAVPPAPPSPDLIRLLQDEDPRIRRRAALSVGRVGLNEGVAPLVALLKDPDLEVRQMAAFGLGLIGDATALDPLVALLADADPRVKGSAAEALGLIGAAAAAPAIAQMAAGIVQSGGIGTPGSTAADRGSPAGAFRLALSALANLRAYEALASAVLDGSGQPVVRWWPVAYALQRIEDPRALPALITLTKDGEATTRAFAARGLGAMKDRATATAALLPLLNDPDRGVLIQTIRALARVGDRAVGPVLLGVLRRSFKDAHLRAEITAALGPVGGEGVPEFLQDLLGDATPAVRAAAMRSLAQVDPEGFVFTLSGLDPDRHWSVRAALASVLATLPRESALPRLQQMLDDTDQRVQPALITAFAAIGTPEAAALVTERLRHDDVVVRVAAANAVAKLKLPEGPSLLATVYRFGQRDVSYVARGAALGALVEFGAEAAVPVLKEALADPDWALRVRAAALLEKLDPSVDVDTAIRPAPLRRDVGAYEAAALHSPPVSTQAYIETDRGMIQLELAVLDAPLTVDNFVTLARKGFFDGIPFHRVVPDFVVQGGDPRGDGEGGPGYTIRDELNQHSYERGTVGMALDWEDTGGSQFFITHSPQPHLDARYTVFGRVLAGMEVVDQIEAWDVIRRVRVWDGNELR